MWYGLGNTAMSNPSTMKITLSRSGRLVFYNGVQDIGQGSNTIMLQILADALGLSPQQIDMVSSDTALTPDAGKTSASRQTFVSGRAVQLAGQDLRQKILRLSNAGAQARLSLDGTNLRISENGHSQLIDLNHLPIIADKNADEDKNENIVLTGDGYFDPPTTPLDAGGQGEPYATYGFAAQIAALEVDLELGTVRLQRIIAAHDVGKAINPTQVEGQIHGGIAQGIGLALMEEFIPGRTENLHDYLIPTIGDVPEIEIFLIEDHEPLGPFGAKGIGEPALIPTAPAILNAIYHATGVRIRKVPALPHRVLEALHHGH
jgi:CO/xanthine dehydrogenase Mo-binding subunit